MFIACYQNFTFDHIVVVPSINVGCYKHLIPIAFYEAMVLIRCRYKFNYSILNPFQGLVAYDTLFHGLGLKA
jgi:hypothetical protein